MNSRPHLNTEFDVESFVWVFCWTVHRWNGPDYVDKFLRDWILPPKQAAGAKVLYLGFSAEEMPPIQPAHHCSILVVDNFRDFLSRHREKKRQVNRLRSKSKATPDPAEEEDLLASEWIQQLFDALQQSNKGEQHQVFRLAGAEPIKYKNAEMSGPCPVMQENSHVWSKLETTCRGAIHKILMQRKV
jgi:hypothetical protein